MSGPAHATWQAVMGEMDQAIAEATPEELVNLAGALRRAELLIEWKLRMSTPMNANGHRPEPEPVLLTYQEASAFLRCSASYVETLVRQGKLPAITLPGTTKGTGEHRRERKGRLIRLRAADLRALAEEHRA